MTYFTKKFVVRFVRNMVRHLAEKVTTERWFSLKIQSQEIMSAMFMATRDGSELTIPAESNK